MIPTANVLAGTSGVVRARDSFAHLDALREEAKAEMAAAFDKVSGKRIDAACLPGFGRHGVSRAANGSATNPLYRIAGLLLLMRQLWMGRSRALRWLEWLRQVVDTIWPPEEERKDLRAVLDQDAEMDGRDERPRQRAYAGDLTAARELLEVKTAQIALGQDVAVRLRQALAGAP
ncbi:MAG TPA: hypothetical protein VFI96_09350 [Longimicrobiaceae bacterium]|nr:hypothetical protein [Longimicrobiaceae bacterium]